MTYSDATKQQETKRLYYASMPVEQRQRYNDTHRRKYHSDPAHNAKCRLAQREQQHQRRREVISAYGGKCACCGEAALEFLAIDHINNDGAAHRKRVGIGSGNQYYLWLQREGYPKGFQVLCHNCNMAKALYGACPHG